MITIPESQTAVVLRTDFSDTATWEQICAAIKAPQTQYGFKANVECLDHESYAGITAETVSTLLPKGSNRSYIFLVDSIATLNPDHPILVVDLADEPGRHFRVIPSEIWSVENNLSLANMIFAEFAVAVDQDGVFRGFPGGPV